MGVIYKSALWVTAAGLIVSLYLESQKWGRGGVELPRAVATATPIVKTIVRVVNEAPSLVSRETNHDQNITILVGVATAMLGAWVVFKGWRWLEDTFGGPAIKVVAEEKAETLTGSVTVATEGPRDLVNALANHGAGIKVLAQHPEIPAMIDIKGVAPRQATLEVLENHPELLQAIDKRAAEIESQVKRKAKLFYGIRS